MPIDLNADLGERPHALADDAAILQSITSANVACGFHAGDDETMRRICERASAHGVVIGAHVSYRDREGFGRRELDVPPEELSAQVSEQITVLGEIAASAGGAVRYVKPHGALYNRAARDPEVAAAVAAGITTPLAVLTLPGSALAAACRERGLTAVTEGFADRGYLADGSLAPRSTPGSILTPDAAVAQVIAIAAHSPIITADGSQLPLCVRSLCLHSDTPGAAELAARVRAALTAADVTVAPFA